MKISLDLDANDVARLREASRWIVVPPGGSSRYEAVQAENSTRELSSFLRFLSDRIEAKLTIGG